MVLRVRASRWLAPAAAGLLWVLVAASLAVGVSAASRASQAGVLASQRVDAGLTGDEAAVIASVGGVAEATVAAWLLDAGFEPADMAAVRTTAVSTGWDVLVAATVVEPPGSSSVSDQPRRLGQRWYVLSLDAVTNVALGPPAQVPPPIEPDVAPVAGESLDDLPEDAATTIVGFFDALLAGGDALDRYITPEAAITAIDPAPFGSVDVDWVRVDASDGTEAVVVVGVTGHGDRQVSQSLQYALQLRRGSRWEVAAITNHHQPRSEQ